MALVEAVLLAFMAPVAAFQALLLVEVVLLAVVVPVVVPVAVLRVVPVVVPVAVLRVVRVVAVLLSPVARPVVGSPVAVEAPLVGAVAAVAVVATIPIPTGIHHPPNGHSL